MTLERILQHPAAREVALEFGLDFKLIGQIPDAEEQQHSQIIDLAAFSLPPTVTRAIHLLNLLTPSKNSEFEDWGDYAIASDDLFTPALSDTQKNLAQNELISLVANHTDVSSEIATDHKLFKQTLLLLQEISSGHGLCHDFTSAFGSLVKSADVIGNYEQLVDLLELAPPLLNPEASPGFLEATRLGLSLLSRRLLLVQSQDVVSRAVTLVNTIRSDVCARKAISLIDANLRCFDRWDSCHALHSFK